MFNATPNHYYQERLREELTKRVAKNPRYSLRSFAAHLGMGPSALSLILSGKRSISTKLVERIFSVLEFSQSEQKRFLESVIEDKKVRGLVRVSPHLKTKLKQTRVKAGADISHEVGLDEFRIISEWYHYAILELTSTPSFRPEVKWIAHALGLSEIEAKLAVERLLKLELLEEKDGTLVKTNQKIDTKDKTKTSAFHRKRQKQILEKSIQSLESDPIETRNHSGITFCINPDRLGEAKAKVEKFMWEMAEYLMEGNRERVYELNVSLFPLQKLSEDRQNDKFKKEK